MNIEKENNTILTEMQLNCIIAKCKTTQELQNLVLEARTLRAYEVKLTILKIQGK